MTSQLQRVIDTNKHLPLFVASNHEYNLKKCDELGIDYWKGKDGRMYSSYSVTPSHLCNFLNKLHREGRLFKNRNRSSELVDTWSDYDPFDPFMTETSAQEYYGDCI
jgi:hypothetical protein